MYIHLLYTIFKHLPDKGILIHSMLQDQFIQTFQASRAQLSFENNRNSIRQPNTTSTTENDLIGSKKQTVRDKEMKESQKKKNKSWRAGNSVWSGRLWVLNKACCPVSGPPSLLKQTNRPAVHFLLSFSDSVPVKAESTTPSQDSLD